MITQNQKKERDLNIGWRIVWALLLIILVQRYLSSSKTTQMEQEYKAQLNSLQEQTSQIMDKYEVQKTEQCRSAVMNTMTFKAEVEEMQRKLKEKQDYKNGICDSLKNKPVDVVNPYQFYEVVKTPAGWYDIKEITQDKPANKEVNTVEENNNIIPE